jgi:hypothetical protein
MKMKRMSGTVNNLLECRLRTTCDNALEVYGIQGVDQVLVQHLTRPKGRDVEEESQNIKQHPLMH